MQRKTDINVKNKTITQRAEDLWNTGDMNIADAIYATDFVHHDPNEPDDPAANKALYMREIEEVWHQSNLDALDDILSANDVNHNPCHGVLDRSGF